MVASSVVVDFETKAALGRRVKVGGYYTDGRDLIEVLDVHSQTGTVTWRHCSTDVVWGSAIEDFRRDFWLVRT